jgi:hypothetical protein
MAKSTQKAPLSIVSAKLQGALQDGPPRPLGEHGLALWQSIQAEYRIQDSGGVELLCQACAACDTAEALAMEIAKDGAVIRSAKGPRSHPAVKDMLAARALISRMLQRLGINVAVTPPRGPGRPPRGW